MVKNERRWWLLWIILGYVLLITLPYLYAWLAGGETHVFAGLLINPMDGNSYLAKMRQGFNGSWTFTLPYTHEPGEGSYINLLYLLLGHIARLTRLPLLLVFHIFRVIGAVLLTISIFQVSCRIFDDEGDLWYALILALFGSGLGWLALMFDQITSDIWVVETFPFLSGYINPHFALGMALQVWLIGEMVSEPFNWRGHIKLGLGALLMVLISPFAMVVSGAVGLGFLLLKFIKRNPWQPFFLRLAVMGLGSGPFLAYYLWLSETHPVLKLWHAQNLTASPAWWDLLIAFSPALLLAVYGAWLSFHGTNETRQLLAVWLVVCLVLVYVPFSLQRRFLQGLYVPVVLLAVVGLSRIIEHYPKRRKVLRTGFLVPSVVTNFLVVISTIAGAIVLDPSIYLWRDEYEALTWLAADNPAQSLVMASGDTGLFIPVYSDDRVLYGHPLETAHAEEMQALVEGFYQGGTPAEETLAAYGVDYVFYGPREQALGRPAWLEGRTPAFAQGDVQVYAVRP